MNVPNGRVGIFVRFEFLSILLAIIFQTFAVIWWASRTESRVSVLELQRKEEREILLELQRNQAKMLQEIAVLTKRGALER